MIKKMLIANRGEIACRISKTAKKMGIRTVAVFSDVDRTAQHVKMSDEAIYIGEPEASQSYLSSRRVIEACKSSGADSIHPGYGFLSENAKFCSEVEASGITFVGPPASAIEAMGDKIKAKEIAINAGVSTVPGCLGEIMSAEEAIRVADEIGYPVMIKASAGGGGKGMRVAFNEIEVRQGFDLSRSEAKKSFDDERVFVEKFIQSPRHIEIQIFGDKYGNFAHLGERECSIQRRNQKVIEEAPSPVLKQSVRDAMGLQAIALARSVGYFSAGTVEFILDTDQKFYFLEMNTRLQVEHPVTELTCGYDLVEEMINIARGEKLSFNSDNKKIKGWAIESRVYAEDPERNFLPASGRLSSYLPPYEISNDDFKVRNDSGVVEGDEISIFYDPMISKLCVWAKTRDNAIEKMQEALDHYFLEGVANNIDFLSAVMENNKFKSGDFSTAFIQEEFGNNFSYLEVTGEMRYYFGIISICVDEIQNKRWSLHPSASGACYDYVFEKIALINDFEHTFKIKRLSKKEFRLDSEKDLAIKIEWTPRNFEVYANIGNISLKVRIEKRLSGYILRYRGKRAEIKILSRRQVELSKHMIERTALESTKIISSPMPGLLINFAVVKGEKVSPGQALCTVEAMKMENVITAEKQGVVKKLHASEGQSLSLGDLIIEFE